MSDTVKVLGQSNPAATTLTTLYTVPGAKSTTCSTFTACNQGAAAATFRLSIRVAAAADTPMQYIYYDLSVASHDTFAATLGITLATTDVVSVYASTATFSFNLFGIEIQ